MAEATDLSGTAQAAEQFLQNTGQGAGEEIGYAVPETQQESPADGAQTPPAQPAQTTTQTQTQTQAQPEPQGEVYEIDGEQVTLSKEDVKFLVKHGARAFLQAQEQLRAQMEEGYEPQAREPAPPQRPQVPPTQQQSQVDPESKIKEYTKTLEDRLGQLEGYLKKQETDRQAQRFVEEAKTALRKVEFFKDMTPEEELEYTGMVLMLQNASRGTLKPLQAAQRLADKMNRHISKATEKWKVSKIEAASQKVEGGGATHPSPPKKVSRHGFFNGEVLNHALDYLRGVKSD